MDSDTDLMRVVQDVFSLQKLAVLATLWEEKPYCNLVAFTPSPDACHLFFATSRTTRKYRNLTQNPFVSMLCDTRAHTGTDFEQAVAITALGHASEATKPLLDASRKLHVARHPALAGFMKAPDCTLFDICVQRYIIARNFGRVQMLAME